jgi:hypothetical protein
MASGWYSDKPTIPAVQQAGRERRRDERVDVLMRVKGELVRPDTPILVHDLSRSGFAVLSQVAFSSGQQLDFRLTGEDGTTVTVTAQAIHSERCRPIRVSTCPVSCSCPGGSPAWCRRR